MFEKEMSRRDVLKVGVVVAVGSFAVLNNNGKVMAQNTVPGSKETAKSKSKGGRSQSIARREASGVLFDDGTTAELIGFGEGYIPEIGDRIAVIDGIAFPLLRWLNASNVKVSGSSIDADGKTFRATSSVSKDSSPGVLLLLDNEKTGESRCLGIQRG